MEIREIQLSEIDDTLEVLEPIPVEIDDYGDEVIATFLWVEAYGFGVNEEEAISNLKEDIKIMFYDLEKSNDNELGMLPLRWKEILLKMIRRKIMAINYPRWYRAGFRARLVLDRFPRLPLTMRFKLFARVIEDSGNDELKMLSETCGLTQFNTKNRFAAKYSVTAKQLRKWRGNCGRR